MLSFVWYNKLSMFYSILSFQRIFHTCSTPASRWSSTPAPQMCSFSVFVLSLSSRLLLVIAQCKAVKMVSQFFWLTSVLGLLYLGLGAELCQFPALYSGQSLPCICGVSWVRESFLPLSQWEQTSCLCQCRILDLRVSCSSLGQMAGYCFCPFPRIKGSLLWHGN